MSQFTVDLDAETVFLDGHWFGKDELAKRIKMMLDGGDFAVSRPSQALEALIASLSNVKTIAVRCTPELSDALNERAASAGKPLGAFIRELLSAAAGVATSELHSRPTAPTPSPSVPEPAVSLPPPVFSSPTAVTGPAPVVSPPRAPPPLAPSPLPLQLNKALSEAVTAPIMAGPGALRAALERGDPVPAHLLPPQARPAAGPPVLTAPPAASTPANPPGAAGPVPALNKPAEGEAKKPDENTAERRWFNS